MAEYTHTVSGEICIPYVQDEIADSSVANKNYNSISYSNLVVTLDWDGDLSAPDLDTVKGFCDVAVNKRLCVDCCEDIFEEIVIAAEPVTQLPRLLAGINPYSTLFALLGGRRYVEARAQVDLAYADGAIIVTDRDLILSKIPSEKYIDI